MLLLCARPWAQCPNMDSYWILGTTLSALKTPSTAPGPVGIQWYLSSSYAPDFPLRVGSSIYLPCVLGSSKLHGVSELFTLLPRSWEKPGSGPTEVWRSPHGETGLNQKRAGGKIGMREVMWLASQHLWFSPEQLWSLLNISRDWGLPVREVREVGVRTRYKFWFSLQSPGLLSSWGYLSIIFDSSFLLFVLLGARTRWFSQMIVVTWKIVCWKLWQSFLHRDCGQGLYLSLFVLLATRCMFNWT